MKLTLLLLLWTIHGADAQAAETQTLRRKLEQIRVVDRDPAPWQLPLGHCVGDCDADRDCESGLVCFQRTRFTAVPGCSGGTVDTSYSDYCIRKSDVSAQAATPAPRPTGYPDIKNVGNNIFEHGSLSLRHCEGDCDDDRKDCRSPMVCQQRDGNEPVFGCSGGLEDSSRMDYCIYVDSVVPPNERSPLPYTSQSFRLKLYWEQGYTWQGENRERKWCMMYNYRGKECWDGLEMEPCDQDSIYITTCKRNEPRQEFAFVHLEGGDEILIRLGGGHNSCFQRDGRRIYLRRCDSSSPRQRWYAANGDFHGYRFEISQAIYPTHCMTQAHHPKEGELVSLESCRASRSRDHQSSYWNVY